MFKGVAVFHLPQAGLVHSDARETACLEARISRPTWGHRSLPGPPPSQDPPSVVLAELAWACLIPVNGLHWVTKHVENYLLLRLEALRVPVSFSVGRARETDSIFLTLW